MTPVMSVNSQEVPPLDGSLHLQEKVAVSRVKIEASGATPEPDRMQPAKDRQTKAQRLWGCETTDVLITPQTPWG